MISKIVFVFLLLTCSRVCGAHNAISEYDLTIQLHLPDSSFSGMEQLSLFADSNVKLASTNLSIDSVTGAEHRLSFRVSPGTLLIELPPGLLHREITLSIAYHGKPTTGLVIHSQEVYSGFNSDSWFPCDHKPGNKARYRLTISIPASWHIAASGDEQHPELQLDGTVRYSFYQDVPIAAYTFGFAAGVFDVDSSTIGSVRSRYFTTGYSHPEVDSIFFDVPNIISYFDSISGIAYPYSSYTQVFTRDDNEQEAVRFCMLSNDYGKEVLADPREEWLLIHELCHQWFGNSITCEDWSDFWLNEGLTTFLTACYKERAFGKDEFDREMYLAHLRYERIRGTAKDLPIVRYNYHKSSEMGGIVTYYKGALVLNYLRSIIGKKAFGSALRSYATKYWQKSVKTSDFEREMERAAKTNLKWFFDEWVYRSDSLSVQAHYSLRKNNVDLTLSQSGPHTYDLPLEVSVTSRRVLKTYSIRFHTPRATFSFPIADSLDCIAIDDEKTLPIPIAFDRPFAMLMYQARYDINLPGKVDAMNELALHFNEYSSQDRQQVLTVLEDAAHASARLEMQVSKNLLKKLTSK